MKIDAATSRKALPPQVLKLNDSTGTVEAGMSDTLLGNQARSGYDGDNERLRSAVCCFVPPFVSLQNTAQLSRGEVLKKLSSLGSARNLAKTPCRV